MHTWLPDAHSEAPTPVSALLSGSLLAVSFYAILRFYQIAAAALGPRFPRDVLLVFGVASLLLAALYLLDQRDYKRLLAYSSVEHMGILAIGVSFGAPVALAGVLLHVLAHAAAKGNAFMGAGVLVRKFGTKQISAVTGGLDLLPWSGPLFLAAILALSRMPPFGIFRSEFEIVAGGLAASANVAAAILVVLVTIAFFGLSLAANRMLLTPPQARAARPERGPAAGEPSAWMVVPVVAGLVARCWCIGLHPPGRPDRAAGPRGSRPCGGPAMSRPHRRGRSAQGAATVISWRATAGDCGTSWPARSPPGRRFAGLMATQRPTGLLLSAHLAGPGGIATHETPCCRPGPDRTRR